MWVAAMSAEVKKIASTAAKLVLAEESSIGVLPGSPVFFNLPVDSYASGSGPKFTLESERPVSQRRRRRGDIVAEDVDGGFQLLFKPTIIHHIMPWVLLSTFDRQPNKGTVFDSAGLTVAGTPADYDIGADAATAGWRDGHLLFAENFGESANNGLKEVTGVSGNTIEATGLAVEASPPTTAVIRAVGIQFGTGELDVAKTGGSFPQLVIASGALLWTQFNIQPGSWIKIGGAAAVNQFVTAANNGYARVLAVTGTTLTIDRAPGGTDDTTDMSAETGTSQAVQVFLSDFIKDESSEENAGFQELSYFMERRLGIPNPAGSPGVIQTEDWLGAICATATFSVEKRAKSFIDFTFNAISSAEHTGEGGDLRTTNGASILDIVNSAFLNNSNHVVRSLISIRSLTGDAAPDPLVDVVENYSIQLSNQAEVQTAVKDASGFAINVNGLVADIDINTYFAEIAGRKSIRANDQIQFELAWERPFNGRNIGVLVDFPSCSLGGGAVDATIDTSMRQPFRVEAAESEEHDLTMSYNQFWYLP